MKSGSKRRRTQAEMKECDELKKTLESETCPVVAELTKAVKRTPSKDESSFRQPRAAVDHGER